MKLTIIPVGWTPSHFELRLTCPLNPNKEVSVIVEFAGTLLRMFRVRLAADATIVKSGTTSVKGKARMIGPLDANTALVNVPPVAFGATVTVSVATVVRFAGRKTLEGRVSVS